jgi:hypothetical protein
VSGAPLPRLTFFLKESVEEVVGFVSTQAIGYSGREDAKPQAAE